MDTYPPKAPKFQDIFNVSPLRCSVSGLKLIIGRSEAQKRWHMRELKNVEERILDRALYLMGVNKTCDIPIRTIAKEAKVNVSAINYYFRSKEELMSLVKEFYLENTMSVFEILEREELDHEEKIILAANEIMEYALRFPGNMVILREAMKYAESDETSRKIVDVSNDIGIHLRRLLYELIPDRSAEAGYKYMIFMSSVNYPAEYDGVEEMGATLLLDKEERFAYLRLLLKTLKAAL